MQKFSAKKNRSTFLGIGVGYLILIVSTVVPLSFPDEAVLHWGVLFPLLLVVFFFYVLTASLLKMYVTYGVGREGISVFSPPFHRRVWRASDIAGIFFATEQETRRLIEASMVEQQKYAENADLIGYVQLLRKRSPAFRYFTVAPTAGVTTAGVKEAITRLAVNAPGGSVIVRLRSGDEYYLTPEKLDRFRGAVYEFLPGAVGSSKNS